MIIAKSRLVRTLTAIGFVCILFAGVTLAQQTVTVSQKYNSNNTPVPATRNAPVPETYLEAVPSNPSSVVKVAFYKNDVPIATVTSSPYRVDLGELGQDTYTFRVRAYYPSDVVADSTEQKFTAYSPKIYKMGTTFLGVATSGPYRYGNHTQQIQNAVDAISADGGGTLFFPCTFGPRWPPPNTELDLFSIYVINDTIKIPANVTLQGEAAGHNGTCQIWWYSPNYNPAPDPLCTIDPAPNMDKPMFQVVGQSTHVRFRDLALRSMVAGEHCYFGRHHTRIATDGTTGIEITTNGRHPFTDGDISDVIIENVAITMFTHGISAISPGVHEIHNIKIRGALPLGNHRQLYIDAPYAYDWDVQNLDSNMGPGQGALEIIKAGVPPGYTGDRGDLRFVQLNCAGGPRRPLPNDPPPVYPIVPSSCIILNKHGGLYFKQVHVEGPSTTIIVNDTVGYDNDAPIVFEQSVVWGKFEDASMKLYMIGSFVFGAPEEPQPSFWDSKMRFSGDGLLSKVVECGNPYIDRTDTDGNPNDLPEWGDYTMSFTHSERQRSSFYDVTNGYAFRKEPISCPVGRTDGIPDTNSIGGAYFDNGILPTEEDIPYTNQFSCEPPNVCNNLRALMTDAFNTIPANNGGAVRIKGNWVVADEIEIPAYRLIVGINGATITLTSAGKSLFKRPLGGRWEVQGGVTVLVPIPASWIVLRDLTLKSTTQVGTTGISFKGTGHCTWIPNPSTPDPTDRMPDPADLDCFLGSANDFSFSGLTIEGFDVGFFGGRFDDDPYEPSPDPMIDSISLKNLKFVNNKTAVSMASSNASNWNIMNLEMQSNTANANGWMQKNGGHQSFQTVKCSGASAVAMTNCLRLDTTGAAVLGIRQGANVTNMVTLEAPDSFYGRMTGHLLIRDSDLRSSVANRSMFYINGKAFITSINNRYQYFAPGIHNEWQKSRVTYCNDDFSGGPDFPGLDEFYDDLNFGIDLPTRLSCKGNPKPWSEAFKWGGQNSSDTPLVGNFYSDTQEDFVVYQRSAQSQFLIRKGSAPTVGQAPTITLNWGLPGDTPVTGKFLDDTQRSQVVAFRNGVWYVKDPNDPNPNNFWAYYWGIAGDKPFAGNFFREPGGLEKQRDEIAIYRPGAEQIWIQNPRIPGVYKSVQLGGYRGNQVQIGDFLGVGNDQIAMFDNGVWYVVDANPGIPTVATLTFGLAGDVPVAGEYLPTASGYLDCTQLGVWRPSTEEFVISDPSSSCGGRGISPNPPISLRWGSNNDYGSTAILDDVPLNINLHTQNGAVDRPVAYRPTSGHFQYSNQNGLWFIHDPF